MSASYEPQSTFEVKRRSNVIGYNSMDSFKTEPYVQNPLGTALKKPDSAFKKYRKDSNWIQIKPDDDGSVFRSTEFKGTRPVTGDMSAKSSDRLKLL